MGLLWPCGGISEERGTIGPSFRSAVVGLRMRRGRVRKCDRNPGNACPGIKCSLDNPVAGGRAARDRSRFLLLRECRRGLIMRCSPGFKGGITFPMLHLALLHVLATL
jgi:hypothetical protein